MSVRLLCRHIVMCHGLLDPRECSMITLYRASSFLEWSLVWFAGR
jgi:hypothetical protein